MPGTRAFAFASRWFDPAIVHRTFEPLIADWQREWHEASPSRRARVSLRGFGAFACAVAISSPSIIATPIPRSIALQVAKRIAVFCLVTSGLLSIPIVLQMRTPSLPTLLLLALIAVLFMVSVAGIVLPLANQKWLVLSTPEGWNTPAPKLRELSTLALLTHPDRGDAPKGYGYTRAGEIRKELINRTVLSMMPAMLVWLRWTTLSQPRRSRFRPLPAGVMTALAVVGFFTTNFSGFILENKWSLRPGTGLWLPIVLFGLWGWVEQRQARHTLRTQP